MKRFVLRLLLGSGACGAALASGCTHYLRTSPSSSYTCWAAKAPAATVAAKTPMPPIPAHTASPPVPGPTLAAASSSTPPVAIQAILTTSDPAPAAPAVTKSSTTPQQPPRRRTFTDVTADPAFAHAPDYRWLIGALEYFPGPAVWRLRYASAEEPDPYGGTVLLAATGLMAGCHSGQLVRVEGQLNKPPDEETPAAYVVKSLRPLNSP